ncbi:MAG: hypothetical protein ACLTQI_08455 [Slackia sp.]
MAHRPDYHGGTYSLHRLFDDGCGLPLRVIMASAVVVVLTAGLAAAGVGLYAAIARRERKREQAARMGVVAGASVREASKPEERLAA